MTRYAKKLIAGFVIALMISRKANGVFDMTEVYLLFTVRQRF